MKLKPILDEILLTEASFLKDKYGTGTKLKVKKVPPFASELSVDDPVIIVDDKSGKPDFTSKGNKYTKTLQLPSGKKIKIASDNVSYGTQYFNIDRKGGSANQPSGAQWESLIVVAYNKEFEGKDWENIKQFWNEYGDIANSIAKHIPSGVSKLEQSGTTSFSPASTWPSSDGTAKTDIHGGSGYRFSVKKAGGSQLMSGTGSDAIGVFQAALSFFEKYDKTEVEKKLKDLIANIENEFSTFKIEDSVSKIKKETTDAYIEWRTPQIEKQGNIKRKEAEKHAKAEATSMGISPKLGNWEKHFIEDIDVISKADFLNWYKKNIKKDPVDSEEVKDLIEQAVVYEDIEKNLKEVFEGVEFSKWCVYEAASGNYKFSGNVDLNSSDIPIANKLFKFNINGSATVEDINPKWSSKLAGGVKPTITFKSSGSHAWSVMRLLTNSVDKTPNFHRDVDRIIEQERKKLNEIILLNTEMLNEIDFRKIGKRLADVGKEFVNRIQNSINRFYENVIKRVINKLKEWIKAGLSTFMEYMGIEVSGKAEFKIQM